MRGSAKMACNMDGAGYFDIFAPTPNYPDPS